LGLKAEDSGPHAWRFTFLVHDWRLASRFPYRVRGHAMCPVRWSLKNQRTAQPLPAADVLRRVGISMCVVVAAWASKAVVLAYPKSATPIAAFAGIGRRNLLDRDTSKSGLVSDELFQLKAWPVVTVCSSIRFGELALSTPLADTRQVFEAYTSVRALCESHDVFGQAVIDVRHSNLVERVVKIHPYPSEDGKNAHESSTAWPCTPSLQSKAAPDYLSYLLSYFHSTCCSLLVRLHSWIAGGYTKRTEVGQLRLQWIQC